MSTLRASLIRLAHQNPELRSQILPLLVDKNADQEASPEMRLASLTVKLAHKPYDFITDGYSCRPAGE